MKLYYTQIMNLMKKIMKSIKFEKLAAEKRTKSASENFKANLGLFLAKYYSEAINEIVKRGIKRKKFNLRK